ncbi:hypothetical protein BDP27DRAFT_1253367, partial [Rhodocollybia butyracea]
RGNSNRRLENIASVSRSSGLEKDGDALKDLKTQEEYRDFIQNKLESYWKHPTRELEENLLILFRKLREGIVSSKRNDSFSTEVNESSLYLATLFNSPRQLGSILPHFVTHPSTFQSSSVNAILAVLLNQLILSYPSQTLYRQSLYPISKSFFQTSSKTYNWITNISSSLSTRNFSKFEKLTRRSSFASILEDSTPESLSDGLGALSISSSNQTPNRELARKALYHAVQLLRARVRDSVWSIIRSSYRELSCNADSGTRDWLIRSLFLNTADSEDDSGISLDNWLEQKEVEGHIRPKENIAGRWIVRKV